MMISLGRAILLLAFAVFIVNFRIWAFGGQLWALLLASAAHLHSRPFGLVAFWQLIGKLSMLGGVCTECFIGGKKVGSVKGTAQKRDAVCED